jgi:NADPH:quinone reductase-like Zn-dependent oxidoreductase
MKAVRFHAHGDDEPLRFEDVPDPRPGPGEAVVRVRAAALNRLDLWVKRGLPGLAVPLPHVPGSDAAGVVESAGAGVTEVRPGDEVAIFPGLVCGACEECVAGRDILCPSFSVLGVLSQGTYAERVKVPARCLFPRPARLTWEEAAAAPLVFVTAWHMLVARARLRAGEFVVIHAAAGGVGTAAVQIAKLLGATVLATAGTDEKRARVKALGADHAIDYTTGDWAAEVRRITGAGAHVVIDPVGPATLQQAAASLRKGGRIVFCATTTGNEWTIPLRPVYSKRLDLLGSFMGTRGDFLEVLRHLDAGRLRPVVGAVFPLAEAAAAQKALAERRVFGKIALQGTDD